MIQRVKGTQDFLDLGLFNFLVDEARTHLEQYNFAQVATPILEPVELFKRGLGLETDVVSKEMYTLVADPTICLRPEATASCMRAFLEHGSIVTPWKVFMWGPMFRHERPQKGRYREFHQINMEIVGTESIFQDAHFIKMLDRFFQEVLHLDTYGLLINFLGCKEDRTAYKKLLHTFLAKNEAALCEMCKVRKERNIMRVFDCKTESCQQLYEKAPFIADHLCQICNDEWRILRHTLEQLSVSYSYKPTLVRGLDYYDKTVFEFASTELGAQNAFCGGGRYNSLAEELGSKKQYPSLGASIGVERALLLLEKRIDRLQLARKKALYVVVPLAREQHTLALLVADELQARKLCTEVLIEGDSVKSLMRQANKLGAKYALIIGPDEQAKKVVTVKQMVTGESLEVHHQDLLSYLTKQ
jgi:histidyl-tRNA synthetase